jgi:DNA gyrase subunit A
MGMTTKEEDFVEHLFVASTHSHILFFTDRGKAYVLKVYTIPQAGRAARGKAVVNLLNVEKGEKLTTFLPIREFSEGRTIVMATSQGIVKKTDLMSFANVRSGGIIAINLDEGDQLISAKLTDGSSDLFISTRNGQAIRFNEEQVREMGRNTRGVKAIKLGKDDVVVSMEILEDGVTILTVTERGFGKRTAIDEYRSQQRGGRGIINMKTTAKTGRVVGIAQVRIDDELMITTDSGKIIRMSMKDIHVIGRNTQGVKLINIDKDEVVTGTAYIAEKDVEE